MRPKHLEELLEIAILNRDNVLVVSDRGMGKSSIINQTICKVKGLIDTGKVKFPSWAKLPKDGEPEVKSLFIHAVVKNPTDNAGMPWVQVKGDEMKAMFIPFGDLEAMMNATGILVVVFDDFGQAPPLVQAGYMQILLAREINGNKISDSVVFLAATNEYGTNSGVHGLLEPVKDRFLTIVHLESNWQDFCQWGHNSGRIAPEVIAYHRWCGTNDPSLNHLNNFTATKMMERTPSPRAWEYVSDILRHGYPLHLQKEMFVGAIGKAETTPFSSFLDQYRDLVHPDLIIQDPENAKIPDNPGVMWSVLTALAGRATVQNFPNIGIYLNRIGKEWAAYVITDVCRKDPKMMKTRTYIEWATVNGEVQFS